MVALAMDTLVREPSPFGGPGILLLDKAIGLSSAAALSRVRRSLGISKIGHGGTLDPFASGLLVCLLGKATRLLFLVHGGTKEYVARVRFGAETTTDDLQGEVVRESSARPTRSDVKAVLPKFLGTLQQVPPQISAKWIGGERAYQRVRRGECVQIAPSLVEVQEIGIVEEVASGTPDGQHGDVLQEVVLRIHCGTGTYIRAIARDLGRFLGCYAHLTELRRTACEPFRVEDAVREEFLRGENGASAAVTEGRNSSDRGVNNFLRPWTDLCHGGLVLHVDRDDARRIAQGNIACISSLGERAEQALVAAQQEGRGEVRPLFVLEIASGGALGLLRWSPEESRWRVLCME